MESPVASPEVRTCFHTYTESQGNTVKEVCVAIDSYNQINTNSIFIGQKKGVGLYEVIYSDSGDCHESRLSSCNLKTKLTMTPFVWGYTKYSDGESRFVLKQPNSDVFKSVCTCSEVDKQSIPVYTTLLSGATVTPDGSIIKKRGHNSDYEIVLKREIVIPEVPETPTPEDVEKAKSIIFAPLNEFCFAHTKDEAIEESVAYQNTVFCLITMALRSTWSGPTPIFIANKNSERVGGSILLDVLSLMAYNQTSPQILFSRSSEENEKNIKTQIISSPTSCIIDNVDEKSEWAFPALLSVTSGDANKTSEIRKFGTLESISTKPKTVWMLNGKNVNISADVTGRVVVIDLNAPTNWSNLKFTRTKEELLSFAKDSHPEVTWAISTLIKNWNCCGKPAAKKLNGNFSEYKDLYSLVGGVMTAAGYDHYLDNLYDVQNGNNTAEIEGCRFIDLMLLRFHDKEKIRISDIINQLRDEINEQKEPLSNHDYSADLSQLIISQNEARDVAHIAESKVGSLIAKYVDRHFEGCSCVIKKKRDRDGYYYQFVYD